jgi:hypothetical protein
VGAGEKVFCSILKAASSHCIPAGYRQDYVPGLSQEATVLIRERDVLRSSDPLDPAIKIMNQEINKIIIGNKRKAWRDKVEAAGQHAEPTKFWGLLRGLAGKRTHVPRNQPITFGSTTCSEPKMISEKFICQYLFISLGSSH